MEVGLAIERAGKAFVGWLMMMLLQITNTEFEMQREILRIDRDGVFQDLDRCFVFFFTAVRYANDT